MNPQAGMDFYCPYCGSLNDLLVDLTGGARQEWVCDCQICCRPIAIAIKLQGAEVVDFRAERENE